ncbi:MAG TPA: AMP-binding protein [Candidatus Binataceae bacterium]|nr:AMP-binding protein [Candidatus Binataceae bacterium]
MGTPESKEQSGVINSAWPVPQHRCYGPQNAFTPFTLSDSENTLGLRFEAQVAKHPEAIAISDGVHEWNYRELNGIANRIATELQRAGGTNDIPVALLFEHCAPAIAAMLATLKAGRCYVPFNPRQPAARLARIFKDCGARVVITNRLNAAMAREISDAAATLIEIDQLLTEPREENLGLSISPDAIACIMFTSGSTGVPKGVAHSHRTLLPNVMNYTNDAHLAPSDRHTLLASYDAGAAMVPSYSTLLNGASLHLFDVRAGGFTELAAWLTERRITIYHSVPQVFRHFVAALPEGMSFPRLRMVRMGGETVTVADVEMYRQRFSTTAILQIGLAATEIVPIRTFFLDAATPLDGPLVPVGYAEPGVEVVILDDDGREAGPEVAGQIAIKSRHLFCGYWRNPALTASVVSDLPDGRRMFRTGDRGVILPGGCLIHLGRRDSMVKISGMSVEVAEVEAVLLRFPGVREAVVIGKPDHRGDMHLIAYIVGNAKAAALRRWLKENLPAPMIPAAFVAMEALPLTRFGKVDRSALPDPESIQSGTHPPRDAIELRLATIWSEVLELPSIGIRDDFFQLGGDSIAALELFSHIDNLFGRRIPMALLSGASTIEQQAKILRDEQWSPPSEAVVTLQPKGDGHGLFWVPGAGNDVVSLVGLARELGTGQPFYGLQPPGQDRNTQPLRTVEALASYFIGEMRKVQPRGPYYLGGGSFGGVVAYEMANQLTRAGERVALLAFNDSRAPGYPKLRPNAPLRFRIFRKFGLRLAQPSARQWPDLRREMFNIWRARFFMRMRKLRGLALTPESAYFNFLLIATRALRRYRPSAYPGRITLFRHTIQPSAELYFTDPLLGWKELAAGGIETIDIDGDHGHKHPRNIAELSQKLRERIRAARSKYDSLDVAAAE